MLSVGLPSSSHGSLPGNPKDDEQSREKIDNERGDQMEK
jgi:hypothetical protein